jgi:hypothetical protein
MSKFSYKNDEGTYDVEMLSDDAKITFNYLVEIQQEIDSLTKRINVLLGAQQSFTTVMNDNLDEEALLKEEV